MTPTPYFERSPHVRLYHGDSLALWPHLVAEGARGVVMFDPQYSEHVHGKSRAGARKKPLRDGNGNLSKAAVSRAKDFGFAPMTEADRAVFAVAAAAMTTRWCLVFSDMESAHLWRIALSAAGLEYAFALLVKPRLRHGGQPLVGLPAATAAKGTVRPHLFARTDP